MGGTTGRYHDTLCGESVNWSHMAFHRDTVEDIVRAMLKVTCPISIEILEEMRETERC